MVVMFRQRGIAVMRSGLGVLIVANLVFTLTVPGVSIGGHIGGLIGGVLAGAVLSGFGRGHIAYGRVNGSVAGGILGLCAHRDCDLAAGRARDDLRRGGVAVLAETRPRDVRRCAAVLAAATEDPSTGGRTHRRRAGHLRAAPARAAPRSRAGTRHAGRPEWRLRWPARCNTCAHPHRGRAHRFARRCTTRQTHRRKRSSVRQVGPGRDRRSRVVALHGDATTMSHDV